MIKNIFLSMIALYLLSVSVAQAEPIEVHMKEMRTLTGKLAGYEQRVAELVEEKKKKKDGAGLEEVLTEISELQKELVGVKKKRRILREHIMKEHEKEELLEDLSLLKDGEVLKANAKKDPDVDARLDSLLATLRKQYARTNRTEQDDYLEAQKDLEKELKNKKKKIKQEDKEEYIKENIKTELKVD
jgi:hypothetical protein